MNQSTYRSFKTMFLEQCPNFTGFGEKGGEKIEEERKLKSNVIVKTKELFQQNLSDESLGKEFFEVLRDGRSTIVGWRDVEVMKKKNNGKDREFFKIIGKLLSKPDRESVYEDADTAIRQIRDLQDNSTWLRDSLLVPVLTMALSVTAPDKQIPGKITFLRKVLKHFRGSRNFQKDLSKFAQDLITLNDVVDDLLNIMKNDWKWNPRDKIDVQSALWIVFMNKTKTTSSEIKLQNQTKNIILHGPPGTGKTYTTARLAVQICDRLEDSDDSRSFVPRYRELCTNKQIEFVTFHQSMTYEDFVEGRQPQTGSDKGTNDAEIGFRLEVIPGIFKRISQRAVENPDKSYVLIIDEINRGNISKIFGELITLLEVDKRLGATNELTVSLPYSKDIGKERFGVPLNLNIIGTMNTSDRSIAHIDVALRRRFSFREILPDSSLVSEKLNRKERKTLKESLGGKVELRDVLETINERIEYIEPGLFIKMRKIGQ